MNLIRTLGGGRGGSHGDFGGFVFSLLHLDRVVPARIMISLSRTSFDLLACISHAISRHRLDWNRLDTILH